MDVYKLVREDERRTLKAYFSGETLELVQAVEATLRALLGRLGTPGRRLPLGGAWAIGNARQEATPRALLGAQGMTWRAYRAGPSRGGCPSGALGRLGVPGGR